MCHPRGLQHPFFHVAIIASLAQELFSTLIATETEEKDLWRFQRDQPESQAFTSTHHVLATVTSQHRGPGWKSQKKEEPGCLEQVVMAPHVWQPQGSCSNAGGRLWKETVAVHQSSVSQDSPEEAVIPGFLCSFCPMEGSRSFQTILRRGSESEQKDY